MLGLHFIKPGRLPAQLARELTALSGLRQMADYGLVSGMDVHAAHEAAGRATAFIEALAPLLPGSSEGLGQQVERLRALVATHDDG